MVIKRAEATHLLALLQTKEREIDVSKLNETGLRQLQLAGLIHFPTPASVSLTYGGEMVARALQEAIEEGLLPKVTDWNDRFRWIGSEILAMMKNAKRSGNVSAIALEALKSRGLAHKVHDKERKTDSWQLNEVGEDVLKAFEIVEPELMIDNDLAHLILTAPVGPTEAVHMPFDETQKEALEAMRIIAYSIPRGDIATFTGIGRAVRKVLENGATAPEGAVIDTLIINLVADVMDGEPIGEEATTQLEMSGYIDDSLQLLPAGEDLMALRALLKNPQERRLFSFALTQEMAETLVSIANIGEAHIDDIKKEMVDKKIAEYKKLIEAYGRRLDEMPLKKRQIAEAFMAAKEHAKWFESHFDIHEYLYGLEAFGLVESSEDEKGQEIYHLTTNGEKVAKDQKEELRAISSQAIKTIKLTHRAFEVPHRAWIEKAREEKILGEYGPGPRGEFYAELSDLVERRPFMTRYEMDVFKRIPNRGMTLERLLDEAKTEHDRHMMEAAVDMLEARGFVEVLADGHIVETKAGELMDRALSGVPDSFGAPITPVIYRVVKAVAEVGTLYEKEKKIRILPKHHKEAYRRSGLSPETFEKAWVAAREAHYLGKNGVNEAGLDLLAAVEAMNRRSHRT